ncbi:MAG: family 16 glycoside hydrolase [Planctomycetota bacterium]
MRPLSVALVGLLLTVGFVTPSDAQQRIPGKGIAYTKTPVKDPNYSLMGEFVGEISTQENETKTLGLQIRSLGGNEFDALTFFGGLPGQEAHEPGPIRLIGRRSEDLVVLSGGPWAVFVEKDGCLLVDRTGKMLGKLKRIDRVSPTMGALPPEGAMVLFDGTNVDHFTKAQMTEDGLLMQGADLKPMFQDFNLHVEFRLPYMPEAREQSRGNSGVYLQSRYECQILDSFAQDSLINGAGALYRFRAPDVNACLPPLVWQTYDIQFTAPRWAADGTKTRNAHITSWLNGVKIQDNVKLPNKTGAGKQEEPVLMPSRLQDHGDPVRFRNVWIVDRGLSLGAFPVYPTPEELAAVAKAKAEAEEKAKQQAEKERKKKAELKAQKEAEAKTKKEAEEKAKQEAGAKQEADAKKADEASADNAKNPSDQDS